MTTPNPDNTAPEADLPTGFSHLSLSTAASGAGTDSTFYNTSSSLWAAGASSSYSYVDPATVYVDPQSHPQNSSYLAAQVGDQQTAIDLGEYGADDTAGPSQPYGQSHDGNDNAGSSSVKGFVCTHQGCGKAYRRQCDLNKHYHNHEKRRECKICKVGVGAETKDLIRHMWTHHPDEARGENLPRQDEQCEECDYKGRKDNLKRHKDKKHKK